MAHTKQGHVGRTSYTDPKRQPAPLQSEVRLHLEGEDTAPSLWSSYSYVSSSYLKIQNSSKHMGRE